MARRNSQQSVSLFPFLAVLVCTMGALILLLLVTTRRMRQEQARYTAAVEVLDDLTTGGLADAHAVDVDDFVVATIDPATSSSPSGTANRSPDLPSASNADAVPSFQAQWLPEVDTSAERLDELQKQVQLAKAKQLELQQQKQSLEDALSDQKSELADVKTQIDELEVQLLTTGRQVRKLEEAESELESLKAEKDDLEIQISQQQKMIAGVQTELEEKSLFTEEAEAVLTKRESALVSLRRLVAKSSENLVKDSSATQLEFTNTDGTSSVPIVINIDEKGFTFEPTGITLTENDLKGFPVNDNPLLAGIQAAAGYRSNGLLPDDAYVLLLVRPSGSLGFYQAQQAMTNANIHFGYELIEADQTVELGTSNSEEAKVVRQSILEALNRRSTLYGALLAAQETRARRAKEDPDQQRLLADARNQSAAGSRSDDLRGSDGRTLQEQLALGRVYAGGVAKPVPDVSGYRSRSQRYGSGRNSEQKVAEVPPPIQQLEPSSQFDQLDAKPAPSGDLSRQLSSPQVASLPDQSIQENTNFSLHGDAAEDGNEAANSFLDFHDNRSITLSENMGLNGQLAAVEMPNPTGAEASKDGSAVNHRFAEDRISPDADWPSVEAAPQQEGPRPVVPELFSNFADSTASQSHINDSQSIDSFGSPTISPRQQSNDSFEQLAETQGQPFSQQQRSPFERSTENQSPAVASVQQSQGRPSTEAVPLINSQAATSAFGSTGSGQQGAGNNQLVDPNLSYLQQFLDEVQEQRSKEVPNAVLLRLLRRAKSSPQDQMCDSYLPPSQSQPSQRSDQLAHRKSVSQSRQPAAPSELNTGQGQVGQSTAANGFQQQQRQRQQVQLQEKQQPPVAQPVYYVVRVYVGENKLVVGPFEPVDISGWSDQQVADAAFLGVSETMKDVWNSVRKDALPAVRFLAANGTEDRTKAASLHLQKLNIATRAMQMEGRDFSLEQFFSDNLPPTPGSAAGRQDRSESASRQAPSTNPQTGSQQQPATASSRRASI